LFRGDRQFLATRGELGRNATVAEAHRAAVDGFGLRLPQWWEFSRDATVAEAHGAVVDGFGLRLPQWREPGRDATVTEAHHAAIGDFGPGLAQRREVGRYRSRGQPFNRIHLVSPRLSKGKVPSLNEGENRAARKKRNVKNDPMTVKRV